MVGQLDITKIYLLGNPMGDRSSMVFILKWLECVGKLVPVGGGTDGMSLLTPTPAEGIKRLNRLYRQPATEDLKLMVDTFVLDISDLTDVLFEVRLDSMLSRRDHLENFAENLEANLKQFLDFGLRLTGVRV